MPKGIDISSVIPNDAGAFIESLPLPFVLVQETKILACNQLFASYIGHEAKEAIIGKSIRNFLSRDSLKLLQEYQKTGPKTSAIPLDLALIQKDGVQIAARVWVQTRSDALQNVIQIQIVDNRDERIRIENLRNLQQQFEELFAKSNEGIAVLEEETVRTVNSAFLTLLGYSNPEQVNGLPYIDLLAESDREHVLSLIHKVVKKKSQAEEARCNVLHLEKTSIPVSLRIARLEGQKKDEIAIFHSDRTENTHSEGALKQLQHEHELLARLIASTSFSTDLETILSSFLSALMDVLGMEAGGIYLLDAKQRAYSLEFQKNLPEPLIEKFGNPPAEEGIGGYLSKTLEAHIFPIARYPSYLPYRALFKEFAYSAVGLIPTILTGRCMGFVLLATRRDELQEHPSAAFFTVLSNELGKVIEAARSYQALSKTENEYRTLIESVNDVLFRAAPDGTFQYLSPNIEQVIGYEQKEFFRNKTLWLSLVHRDDKKFLLDRSVNLESLGDRIVLEYRVLPKGKAAYRWIRDVTTIVRDRDGKAAALHGVLSDVTNYRSLAEELVQSNELNSSILSSVQEGVVVYNLALRCIQWNDAMERITGLKKEVVLGKPVVEIFSQEGDESPAALLEKALSGENIDSQEVHIVGSEKDVFMWGRYGPLRDARREIIGAVGIITDISERKTLERELKESEQVLRNVIDTMGDILMITDLKGDVLEINRAFLNVLGYTRNQIIGHEFPYPWLIDEEMGRYVLWIGTLREKNWLHDFDMTWRSIDGKLVPMSLSTTMLRNSLGEPIAMVNIARDITDRKRLMQDLENRKNQVELLNRIITAANQTMDFDTIFGKITEEIRNIVPFDDIMIGLLNEDGESLNVFSALHEAAVLKGRTLKGGETISCQAIKERKPIIVNDLTSDGYGETRSAQLGYRSQISLPILLENRTLGAINIASKTAGSYNDQSLPILQSIASQTGSIIDRILLFNKVSEDASYIHNLLDSIDSVVYTIDAQYRILEVNKAWFEFVHECGAEVRSDYHGMSIFDAIPDESLKVLYQTVGSDILSGVVRFFSQEFAHPTASGKRIYQVTMNPMIIDRKITGLVISHSDITALKESEIALKKNNEQLVALNELSTLFSTSRHYEEILATALPLLRQTLGADAGVVYLIDRTGIRLELAHQTGFRGASEQALRSLVLQGSAMGMVVGSKESVYITGNLEGRSELHEANREFYRSERFESIAIIPLTSKEKVLGALNVFYRSIHLFTDRERQLLNLIGNQLGTAVDNAQLYGELRSQIERLTVLYEFSEHLTSKLDPHQIYDVVADHIARVMPFSGFSIELLRPGQQQFIQAYGIRKEGDGYEPMPAGEDVGRVVSGSPEWHVLETKRSYHDTAYTMLYVPMSSKQSIIGMMVIRMDEPQGYSETHIRLLESIGILTAIALEKGKLYEETIQKSLEIERRNQELDDFTYVVSHDLKEPLISIEGFSKILQIDYRDLLVGEGKDYLDSITGAAVRMKALIDDLLMLSRVGRASESFKEFSIAKVIGDIITDMEFKVRQRNVRFIVQENLPMVTGNETHIKIVFGNLIGNALKFNLAPQPLVEVGFQITENYSYLFYVKDNGIGIEPEFFEKIFVIFQRLHRREDYEGTGAGLAIVKKIIEMHKGRIWVESEQGKGSTFFFTLPKHMSNE